LRVKKTVSVWLVEVGSVLLPLESRRPPCNSWLNFEVALNRKRKRARCRSAPVPPRKGS
jgi:hypothetical protein